MKQTILLAMVAFPQLLCGQQVLFFEDFESPSPDFALNTTDVSSTASGDNTWLINNVYAGGSGSVICLIIPVPFTVAATAAQPAGISTANSRYLHTSSTAAINSGVQNCCFLAADGLCANAANHFVRMSDDVSTGTGDVTLSFWWLCGGGTNNYGEVYYSTNGGGSWNLVTTPIAQYRDQASWVQQTITLPEFGQQPTLRFGFRFVNGTTTSAQDPGFGLDDVNITESGSAVPSVITGGAAPASVCQGGSISVPYTAAGAFDVGNVFTAELSDASGSFASPVNIGSVSSTTSGTILATVPIASPAGSGYRVRVVSSAPATTGSIGGVTITVSTAPFAGNDSSLPLCSNSGVVDLFSSLGSGVASCGAWTGPSGAPFNGQFNSTIHPAGDYTYATTCPGGCPQDAAVITVTVSEAPNAGTSASITVCANGPQVDLLSILGGDAGGSWSDPNGLPFSGVFDPTSGSAGLYTYIVQGVAPCSDAQAVVALIIDPCTSIQEATDPNATIRWYGQDAVGHLLDLGEARLEALELIDPSGRLIPLPLPSWSQGLVWVSLDGVASGVHLLRLSTGQGTAVIRLVHQAY